MISPPITPPPAIKDAAPLLLQAQAHYKDGNPLAAMHIYKMVLQGSTQPKYQQAARAAIKPQALDELAHMGMREPGAYARILAEYETLGVFTPAEQKQLAAMAPDAGQAEDVARNYQRYNPKGALRDVAEATIQAVTQLRAREAEKKRRLAEDEQRFAEERARATEELQYLDTATGFIAIDANRNPGAPGNHACVRDNKTGLLWSVETLEVMTWDSAMRAGNGYSRCGFGSGWRLPSKNELLSLMTQKDTRPMTDTRYFPDTKPWYWANDTYAPDSSIAWVVFFNGGGFNAFNKTDANYVRLVRSGR